MTNLLQILPRVPPAVCGIGDYAWGIARGLRDDHAIHSQFLSAGTSWSVPQCETEFPVSRVSSLTASSLVDFVQGQQEVDAIVLHMSSYGYQKRAVPLWMASAWQRLARFPQRPRMIAMFHELYASGPVRSSAFWLQPLQKWVLRRLARASDALRTNRQSYADWLLGVPGLQTNQVEVMPVHSNFGEPELLPSLKQREPAMAMFASGIHSGESMETVLGRAAACCRRFGLSRLHLIGWKKDIDETGLGVEVVRHGFLEATEISRLLLNCRMAYTAYSPLHFGKSGVVAAFAAHGLVVITQGRSPELPDGLEDGRNVLHEASLSERQSPTAEGLDLIGRNLRTWYDAHSLAANVRSYAAQIRGNSR
jgi:hypothetical protein